MGQCLSTRSTMRRSRPENNLYPIFRFEHLQDPAGEWIPLVVRMKLDLSECRITLDDWQALTDAEKHELCRAPIDNAGQIREFSSLLSAALDRLGRAPTLLPPDKVATIAEWNQSRVTPDAVAAICRHRCLNVDWKSLDRYDRYVLWSLARKNDVDSFCGAIEEIACRAVPARRD